MNYVAIGFFYQIMRYNSTFAVRIIRAGGWFSDVAYRDSNLYKMTALAAFWKGAFF